MRSGVVSNLWLCAAAQLIACVAQAASSPLPDAVLQSLALATQPHDPARWKFLGAVDNDDSAALWLETASVGRLGDLVSTDMAVVKLEPDRRMTHVMARFFFDCRRPSIAAYPLSEPVSGAAMGAPAFDPQEEALLLSRALKDMERASEQSVKTLVSATCDFARQRELIPVSPDSSTWPTRLETQLRASIDALNVALQPMLDDAFRMSILVDFIESLAAKEASLYVGAPTLTRFDSGTHAGAAVLRARLPPKSKAGEEPIPICVERAGQETRLFVLAAASQGKLAQIPATRFSGCDEYLAAQPLEPPSWQEYR